MNTRIIIIIGIISFVVGYIFYGKFLKRFFSLRSDNNVPSHNLRDGVDYVPTKLHIVMGHHFASIAGAGPIVGPVLAVKYGWLPAFLWIIVGSIFIGAVHDFTSLVASLRHRGEGIGNIIDTYIGRRGKLLFAGFTFFALVLVIAVFVDVVAKTFIKSPVVASSSTYFILFAIVFGLINYRVGVKGFTSIFLALVFTSLAVYLGFLKGFALSYNFWTFILLIYCYLAAILPVWFLLQPRDYLNSFILYALLFSAVAGIFVGGGNINTPVFTGFAPTGDDWLFPFLFVTVACGAISGFHSLVSSGTTSKQINKETDALPVGYGMMLLEGLLGLIALSSAGVLSAGVYSKMTSSGGAGPIAVFASGMGSFLSNLGISHKAGFKFSALAVSAFALTSLDTCTRLARFVLEEVFFTERERNKSVRYISSLVVIFVSAVLLLSGGYSKLWTLFGSVNQLLASLALLAVFVWVRSSYGKKVLFIEIPMYFVFAFTSVSLILTAYHNFMEGEYLLAFLSGFLFALAVVLLAESREKKMAEVKR